MKNKKEEERRRRRRTKWIFLGSDFATPTKVSETLGVVLHLNSEGLLVPRLRTRLGVHFRAGAPIRDVQDAILNIGHSYLARYYRAS